MKKTPRTSLSLSFTGLAAIALAVGCGGSSSRSPVSDVFGDDPTMVTICHVAEDSTTTTMSVSDVDVPMHMAHGDTMGECEAGPGDDGGDGDGEGNGNANGDPQGDGKGPNEAVTLCHKADKGSAHTIVVSGPALDNHLAHGDTEGACGDPGGDDDDEEDPDGGTADILGNFGG